MEDPNVKMIFEFIDTEKKKDKNSKEIMENYREFKSKMFPEHLRAAYIIGFNDGASGENTVLPLFDDENKRLVYSCGSADASLMTLHL